MDVTQVLSAENKTRSMTKLVEDRFDQSMRVPEAFFSAHADQIARACWEMARRFHQGGRLIAFGNGAWASDAQHVSVEFVHPVIVGKRALPALALTNDGSGMPFQKQLSMIARSQDIAVGFSMDGRENNIVKALSKARELGLLTLGMTSGDGGELVKAELDFCFTVPSEDVMAVQETHETLYHILWELVHVFFEHEGLLK